MSQRLISSFFKPSQGMKRKNDDDDDDDDYYEKPPIKKQIEDCDSTTQDNLVLRSHIIAWSKVNPALSSNIGLSWFKALANEFDKEYFRELGEFLRNERANYTVYPPENDVYFWTNTMKILDVRVVILGQDPYHGPNQAHGLAFSVRKGVPCPPSLRNIYKELSNDIPGFTAPNHGFLNGWAIQGVLLLNTTLTVRASCPNSHKDAKWNYLTDAVIKWIDDNLPHSVFMLWGKNAQEKISLIGQNRHLILTAPHPSPFSADRGFFGCCHFSKANEYLQMYGKKPINWSYLP